MKLPVDPSQWAALVMRELIAAFPSLEPYIQSVRLQDQDEEGNAYGLIVLTGGFVPFVVRELELRPFDTLIAIENGEMRFRRLTEANAIMAIGGIGLGTPIAQMPPGVSSDMEISMLPPRTGRFGHRMPTLGVLSSVSPVKLAALFREAATVDPELPRYLAATYREPLSEAIARHKQATPATLIWEPRDNGTVNLIAAHGQPLTLPLKEAARHLRERWPAEAPHHIAALRRGEFLIMGERVKRATPLLLPPEPMNPKPIKEPGWYEQAGQAVRVFATRYLDGRPCSWFLRVSPTGHAFSASPGMGVAIDPPNSFMLELYYPVADLHPNELCFLLQDRTGAVSIPFRVVSKLLRPDGSCVLTVDPLLGDRATEELHFGNNREVYRIGPDRIAFPRTGWSVFRINPGELRDGCCTHDRVQVRILKGGGTYTLYENRQPAYPGLTRGQVLALLMERYGMDADTALHYVQGLGSYLTPVVFEAHPREEEDRRHDESMAFDEPRRKAAHLACLLWQLVKRAAPGAPWEGTERKDLDPGRSGSNRQTDPPPGPSGPPTAMAPDQAAGVVPDVPFLRDVADLLTGYATGTFSPSELSEIYRQLQSKLADIEDLVGRVLTLARLGKTDFVTEHEAKRVLDESDKFRSTILNADMLLRGVTAAL